jgi:hypothetical protein
MNGGFMRAPSAEEKEKLTQYRQKAQLIPSWDNKYLEEKEIVTLLARILPQSPSLTLPESMKEDLRISSLYGAVARWCDPENGLARYYPEQIIQVAEQLLKS